MGDMTDYFEEQDEARLEAGIDEKDDYMGDGSEIELPPQVKGKLEFHSTPKNLPADEQIANPRPDQIRRYGESTLVEPTDKLVKILYDFGEGKYNKNGLEIATKKLTQLINNSNRALLVKYHTKYWCSCGNSYYPHKGVRLLDKHKKAQVAYYREEEPVFCCLRIQEAWNDRAVHFGEADTIANKDIYINITVCRPYPEGAAFDDYPIDYCPFCSATIKQEALQDMEQK